MSATASSPTASLQQETQAMSSLLELIRREQEQLVAMDVDRLSELTGHKAQLVNELAALSALRYAALATAGFAPKEEGMAAWLASANDGDQAHAQWSALLALTREAKEMNRLNGMLINKHLVHTQGALQALRPASTSPTTYGPSGQTMNGPSQHRYVVG